MSRPGQHSDPDTHGNAWLAVVMPAHNEAEHLEACLASFVQQTPPPKLRRTLRPPIPGYMCCASNQIRATDPEPRW